MKYGFLITFVRKIIPPSKFKHKLAYKFQKQLIEYRNDFKGEYVEYTGCSKKSIDFILSTLQNCINEGLEGEIIECGVFRGGSLFQIAKKLKKLDPQRKLYALDTFEGHPYDDYEDMPAELVKQVYKNEIPEKMKGIASDTDLNEIKKCFKKYNLGNTLFLKGLFIESFKLISEKKFCLAHVDADSYLSVKQCIEFLKERIVPKGVIIFDDYNYPGIKGCNKAVDDLIGKESLEILKPYGAYWIKKVKVP